MGNFKNELFGMDTDRPTSSGLDDGVFGDGNQPGVIGIDDPIPLDVQRMIAKVEKAWDVSQPRRTPEIVINGNTLEAAARALNALPEWGQAGGQLKTDTIGPGNTTNLTVTLRAGLVYRLPRWANYAQASPPAKAEWDRMFAFLKAHEDRHLAIAVEEAEQLASDLVGHEISDIPGLVTAANRRMAQRQQDLDDDTDHGAKEKVKYGDVILDISIK